MKYFYNGIYIITTAVYISAGIGALFIANSLEPSSLKAFCVCMAGIGSFYHGITLNKEFIKGAK